jgi:hypothetical protein
MASRKDIVAGGAAVEIRAIDQATKVVRDVSQNFMTAGKEIAAMGLKLVAASAAATTAIVAMSVVTASWGASIDDAAKRTGVSAEALQELRYGAEQSGASFEDLVAGIRNMNKLLADEKAGEKLSEIGVDLEKIRKLKPEEQFAALADAIAKVADASQQTSAAMEIFGKGGFSLLPFLQEGSAGIQKFQQDAHELGLVLSGDVIAAFAEYDDTVARITASTKAISSLFAASFLPILQPIADALTGITSATAGWLEENQEVGQIIALVIAATAALGVGLVALGSLMAGPISLFASFATIASGWIAVLGTATLPVTLLTAGIAALAAIATVLVGVLAATYVASMDVNETYDSLISGTDGWYTSIKGIVDYIRAEYIPIFAEILEAIKASDFETAGKLAMLGLKRAFAEGLWELREFTQQALADIVVSASPANQFATKGAEMFGFGKADDLRQQQADWLVSMSPIGDMEALKQHELNLIDQELAALRTKFQITQATNAQEKTHLDLMQQANAAGQERARLAGEQNKAAYDAYYARMAEENRLRKEREAQQFAMNLQQQQPQTGYEPHASRVETIGTSASGIAGMVVQPMMGVMEPVVKALDKQLTVQTKIEQNTKNMAPTFGA